MLQDNDIKAVLNDASAFFKNYSALSLHIQPMSQSLATLGVRLDSVTHAITAATKQAAQSGESSASLAKSLNRFTLCLVIIGALQVFFQGWYVIEFIQSIKH